jgi:non-specific protein-tyrosine kinase
LFKWWWLIVLATVVAVASGYLVTRDMPPVYMARTTLMVGRALTQPSPSDAEFSLSHELATTYADLAMRAPIANAVQAALGLTELPEYKVNIVAESHMIEIQVTDTNPERASAVANELANQLILQTPTSVERTDQQRQAFVNQQLDTMQAEIIKLSAEIDQKQADLQRLSSAAQLQDAQNELIALQTKLTLLQGNYATLLSNSQRGATNSLAVVEPATTPTIPIGPKKMLIMGLVAVIGLVLSAGAAHLLEFLDKSLKSPEEITKALGLPVIGYIRDIERKQNKMTYVAEYPRSPLAEAFRALRTNIEFSSVDKPLRSILVTSPNPGDGKTTVAANLALVMAQGDKKILLLDGDLRRPRIHEMMNGPVSPGLTDVIRGMNVFDAVRQWKEMHIGIMTAGNPPPNPAELLGSKKMEQVLTNLESVLDSVVIDGAPFVVTDSMVMASKVDGVIIVMRPGQTRMDVARAMNEQLIRSGANVVGVVLNRISHSKARSYSGYSVYSPYYGSSKYFEDTSKKALPEKGHPEKVKPVTPDKPLLQDKR